MQVLRIRIGSGGNTGMDKKSTSSNPERSRDLLNPPSRTWQMFQNLSAENKIDGFVPERKFLSTSSVDLHAFG